MKRRWPVLLALAFLCATKPSFAIDVAGVNVPDEATLGGQRLVLNGAGIRYRFGFQVYVCALYLARKRSSLEEIVSLPAPKRIAVTTLREISSEDLGDAFLSGIRRNSTPEQTRYMGVQLVKLGELFGSIPRLKKGDSFTIDYTEGVGTVIAVNGTSVLEPLPDKAFYDALLRIWLGASPADDGLKTRLLGLPVEPPKTNFR